MLFQDLVFCLYSLYCCSLHYCIHENSQSSKPLTHGAIPIYSTNRINKNVTRRNTSPNTCFLLFIVLLLILYSIHVSFRVISSLARSYNIAVLVEILLVSRKVWAALVVLPSVI